MLTGFDEERGAVRSFYREDIERYLDINFNETRRNTTKPIRCSAACVPRAF
jgi:hypothetical protein